MYTFTLIPYYRYISFCQDYTKRFSGTYKCRTMHTLILTPYYSYRYISCCLGYTKRFSVKWEAHTVQDTSFQTTLNSTREWQHTRSRQGYRYTEVRCRWKMVIMREGEKRTLRLFSFTLIPVLLLVINYSYLSVKEKCVVSRRNLRYLRRDER